jgi:hypothetical protein
LTDYWKQHAIENLEQTRRVRTAKLKKEKEKKKKRGNRAAGSFKWNTYII